MLAGAGGFSSSPSPTRTRHSVLPETYPVLHQTYPVSLLMHAAWALSLSLVGRICLLRGVPSFLPCTWLAHVSGPSPASRGSPRVLLLASPTPSSPGVQGQCRNSTLALGTQRCLRWVTQSPNWRGGTGESPKVAAHPDYLLQVAKLNSSPPPACHLSKKGEFDVINNHPTTLTAER